MTKKATWIAVFAAMSEDGLRGMEWHAVERLLMSKRAGYEGEHASFTVELVAIPTPRGALTQTGYAYEGRLVMKTTGKLYRLPAEQAKRCAAAIRALFPDCVDQGFLADPEIKLGRLFDRRAALQP